MDPTNIIIEWRLQRATKHRKMNYKIFVKDPINNFKATRHSDSVFSCNGEGFRIVLDISDTIFDGITAKIAVIEVYDVEIDGELIHSAFNDLVHLAFFVVGRQPKYLYSPAFIVTCSVRCEPTPVLDVKGRHVSEPAIDPFGEWCAEMLNHDLGLLYF
jgi:hypothetical protein